jgi:hypothetical protein
LPTDVNARLGALATRCAAGYRVLQPATKIAPAASVDVVLPANTCARVVLAGGGTAMGARLRRPSGTVVAAAKGDRDAVLPPAGPICTAQGETFRLELDEGSDATAQILVSP